MPPSSRAGIGSMSRAQPLLAHEINHDSSPPYPRRSPSPILPLSDSAPPSPSSRVSSFGSSISFSTKLPVSTFILFYLASAGAATCTIFLHASVLYYATIIPVYCLTSIIAAVGLHRRSSSFLRPSLITHTVLTACLVFLLVCTAIDYTHKCHSRLDYTDRTLSLARTFDCEYGGITTFVEWTGLAVSAVLLQAGLVGLLVGVSRKALMHVVVEDVGLVVVSFCIAGLASVALCGMTLILTFSAHETLHPTSASSSAAAAAAANATCPLSNGLPDYPSPINPLLFTLTPQPNDLGCCTHLPPETNCCHQTACAYKRSYMQSVLQDGRSSECHDLLGLVSCAPCDGGGGSGGWASGGWDGMAVCSTLCERMWTACAGGGGGGGGGGNGTGSASGWCESELRVKVVAGGVDSASVNSTCYNSAMSVSSTARLLSWLLPIVALMWISSCW